MNYSLVTSYRLFSLLIVLAFSVSTPAHGVVFNIEDFGAVSGGGDDSGAFRDAFAAASAGDTVLIPAGSYDITTSIQPKGGVILAGAGRDLSTVRYLGNSNFSMIRLQNVGGQQNNVELTGFTLDGMNNTNISQGIVATNTEGGIIRNLRIRNLRISSLVDPNAVFGPHGILYGENVSNTRIENNEFLNIGTGSRSGSGIRLAFGSNNNLVANNTIQNTGRGGIHVNGGSLDNIVRSNTITGTGLGSVDGLGIEIHGSDRTIVEDNNIDYWLSIAGSSFVAARRNTVAATDGRVQFAGIELIGDDVIVTNNTVGLGNDTGLSITGGGTSKERVYVANNTFSDSATNAVRIQDHPDGGRARQFYLYNNTFSGSGAAGFRFNLLPTSVGVRQFVFDSNKIVDNDGVGLQILGADEPGGGADEFSFVNNNTITGNGDVGIDVGGNQLEAKNLEWDASNVVSGNGGNGLNEGGLTSNGFANGKPTASITANDADLIVTLGQAIDFGFLYSDDGAPAPAEVLWDFDEGLPVVDFTPTHTFTEVRSYTITLLAWDAQGRAARSEVLVQVVPVPEPSTVILVCMGVSLSLLFRKKRRASLGSR